MNIERLPNESYIEYARRLTDAVGDGFMNWQEWSDAIVGVGAYSSDSCAKNGRFFRKFLEKCDDTHENSFEKCVDSDKNSFEKMQLERKKIQDANRELQATYREQARHELFNDRLLEAIDRLPPIDIQRGDSTVNSDEQVGVMCIADAHLGLEVNMRSVLGEPINIYNRQILEARLGNLLNQFARDCAKFSYSRFVVFDLGDSINNYLRWSDTNKVKTGILDNVIWYAEMMCQFLTELYNIVRVPIKYHIIGSNHAQLRILDGKPNFPEEDVGKIIRELIALRLKDISDDEIFIDKYGECAFENINGCNILAYHGHNSKTDAEELSFWENYHGMNVDILILGHNHNDGGNTVGYAADGDKKVIHAPSLCGIDTFSAKCRKMSRAGVKFFTIENGRLSFEKTYILN